MKGAGYCSTCKFKTATQRKFGVTYSCDKEVTHMDVTFHTHERHKDRKNLLCPLINRKGGSGYDRS